MSSAERDIAGILVDPEGWDLADVRLEPGDRLVARYEAQDGAGWVNVILLPKNAPVRKLKRLEHCSVYYEGELAERSFEHRSRAAELVASVSHAAEERLARAPELGFPRGLAALEQPLPRIAFDHEGFLKLLPELGDGALVGGWRLMDRYPGEGTESVAFELGEDQDDRRVVLEISPRRKGRQDRDASEHFRVAERTLSGSDPEPARGARASMALVELLLRLRDSAELEVDTPRLATLRPEPVTPPPLNGDPRSDLLASEARALGPMLEAASRFFGVRVRLSPVEGAPVEAYAITFPPLPAGFTRVPPYFRAPHALWHRRTFREYFRALGYAVHPDGLVRTVPTPESLVALLAAQGVRGAGLRPRLFRTESQRLPRAERLELYAEGTLPTSVGTPALYDAAEPVLRLGVARGFWLEHFATLGHDMSTHVLATHRIPAAAVCELGAMVSQTVRLCRRSERPDALAPLADLYEQDLVQVCQEIWERIGHPDAFGEVFTREMHRIEQRAKKRASECDAMLARAPAARDRLAHLSQRLDPARDLLLEAGRAVARWLPPRPGEG